MITDYFRTLAFLHPAAKGLARLIIQVQFCTLTASEVKLYPEKNSLALSLSDPVMYSESNLVTLVTKSFYHCQPSRTKKTTGKLQGKLNRLLSDFYIMSRIKFQSHTAMYITRLYSIYAAPYILDEHDQLKNHGINNNNKKTMTCL